MAITREQLHRVLFDWCIAYCWDGFEADKTVGLLTTFCGGSLLPQEENVLPQAATFFEQNRVAAYTNLKARLKAIGFHTNLNDDSVVATKQHNLNECAAWANGPAGHQIEEIYGVLRDLKNWQHNYRGSKAILNALKIVRMYSRNVV